MLAKYITLSVSKRTDALVIAEMWDRLRDSLLILVSYRPDLDLDVSFSDDGMGLESGNPGQTFEKSDAADHICRAMEAIIERGCSTTGSCFGSAFRSRNLD